MKGPLFLADDFALDGLDDDHLDDGRPVLVGRSLEVLLGRHFINY